MYFDDRLAVINLNLEPSTLIQLCNIIVHGNSATSETT